MIFKHFLKMDEATDPVDLLGGADPATPADPVDPPAPTTVEEGWLKGVESDLASHTSMGAIKDINSLVKSYIHGQKLIGKDKIVLPDEHATDDDINAFYDKLGRPELDKYEVDFGEAQYGDDFKKAFVAEAHKAGIMPKQAKSMFDFIHGQITSDTAAAAEAKQTAATEAIEGLRREWGNGFDKQVTIAQQAVATLADDNFKEYLKTSGLGSDPTMIKFFANIGSKLNEDTFDKGTVKHLGMTKDEAQEAADSIYGNFEHPYWNKSHPNHKKAVADMQKYNKILVS